METNCCGEGSPARPDLGRTGGCIRGGRPAGPRWRRRERKCAPDSRCFEPSREATSGDDRWRRRSDRARSAALLFVAAVGILHLLPRSSARTLLAEGGPVEAASAALLGLAAVVALRRWAGAEPGAWGAAAVLLLAAMLRELDFHDRFTSRGISQLRFYTSAAVPWAEKALALVAVALLAAAAYRAARWAGAAYRDGRRTDPLVVLGGGLWLLAWTGDRLVRWLVFGLEADADAGLAFSSFAVEETAELWGAALLLAAVGTAPGRAARREEREPESGTTSPERDIAAGRPSEPEAWTGRGVRPEEEAGASTPASRSSTTA